MKQLAFTFITMLGLTAFSFAQNSVTSATPNPNAAEITFKKEVHDFGKVKNGGDATYEFEFTNTGKEPLIIQEVQKTCGCTTPSWPKEPIMPGKTGKIKVQYDTKRTGKIDKKVTILSNAKTAAKELFIKGEVLPAEAQENLAPVRPSGSPSNN